MRGPHQFPATVLAAFACACVLAQEPGEESSGLKQTEQWIEHIEHGGTVRVLNPFGNVYARFGGYADEVEVLATIQHLEQGRPRLEVARTPDGRKGLEVTVGFAGRAAGARPEWAETRDRVDLVVFVPQGAVFDVETRDGEIEVKGIEGDVAASSIHGNMRITAVKGRVRAKSARGRIAATLENGVTEEAQDLRTETGDIEVYLWEDAHMDVRLATSGEISTDFSIEIEHRRFEEPGKQGRARVGKGGPGLTLESKRGHLSLLRLQRDFKPERPGAGG